MNCLEFRRQCLTEPATRSEAFVAHREQCGECRRFAAGVDVLDGELRSAMQVPVPEDLEARIKLRRVIGDEDKKRRARPWQYALAASVLLSVTISGFFGYRLYTANQYIDTLQVTVLDHIKQEPELLRASNHSSPAQFKRVLAVFGGELKDVVAPVQVAEVCALHHNHQPIVHAVLKGKMGAVTVLYIRGNRVKQKIAIADAKFKGVLLPAGTGNLAVVGLPDEPLAPMVDKLEKSIVWKI